MQLQNRDLYFYVKSGIYNFLKSILDKVVLNIIFEFNFKTPGLNRKRTQGPAKENIKQ